MDTSELLIIKAELTDDPLNLGLTTNPSDDEANANILNQIRETIRVARASLNADEIRIPVDEWSAMSPGQQSWWTSQTTDGTVRPAVIQEDFYGVFGSETLARASWDSVATEAASRARQLLNRYVNLTPSDVANARQAT